MSVARLRRPRVLALLVTAVALVVVLVVVLAGGDDADDDRAGLRDVPAVTSVTDEDGELRVALRPGTRADGVAAALRALTERRTGTEIRLGRGVLVLRRRGTPDPRLATVLVAVAGVRTPGGPIELQAGPSEPRLSAQVDRPELAAPLALEVLDRVLSGDRLPAGLRGLLVYANPRSGGQELPIALRSPTGVVGPEARAALRAASRLTDRSPRLFAGGRTTELRVRARSLDDAAVAWREATAALGRDAEVRREVEIAVDLTAGTDDVDRSGEPVSRPVLAGAAADDPSRALALARRMSTPGSRTFARTDLGFAQARATSISGARTAAVVARDGSARRVAVSWPAADEDDVWFGGVGTLDRDRSEIDDGPGRVVGLVDGARAMRSAGIAGLRWDRRAADGVPQLRITRPSFLGASSSPVGDAAGFRRLSRAVRALGWNGTAQIDLLLGPGDCSSTSTRRAQTVATILSTSTGRARSVEAGAACADPAALRAARRAWDAGAR
ncbi:hypothetical protein [Patulibacter sp.]|uniref:hypothetical protein n=1 Tax=Patulibacter sp. TaxID=1912859 RepID=UPI002716A062|nr:hypothetical protein [Patulibacter sp.]MDO9408945.1 hypothetical protein [Patulibacter sp.]